MSSASEKTPFQNSSSDGEIPSFNGDEKAQATDFANYFCTLSSCPPCSVLTAISGSYAQLYHQKQMLADHNRMAAYHSAILGNQDVFRDKVVMDIGTGSGILAVWAAQAGARRVYAIEYTDMAAHAKRVMAANGVDHIVTVIQGAVEQVELPAAQDGLDVEDGDKCIDIIVSEWYVFKYGFACVHLNHNKKDGIHASAGIDDGQCNSSKGQVPQVVWPHVSIARYDVCGAYFRRGRASEFIQ